MISLKSPSHWCEEKRFVAAEKGWRRSGFQFFQMFLFLIFSDAFIFHFFRCFLSVIIEGWRRSEIWWLLHRIGGRGDNAHWLGSSRRGSRGVGGLGD